LHKKKQIEVDATKLHRICFNMHLINSDMYTELWRKKIKRIRYFCVIYRVCNYAVWETNIYILHIILQSMHLHVNHSNLYIGFNGEKKREKKHNWMLFHAKGVCLQ